MKNIIQALKDLKLDNDSLELIEDKFEVYQKKLKKNYPKKDEEYRTIIAAAQALLSLYGETDYSEYHTQDSLLDEPDSFIIETTIDYSD